MEQVVNGNPRRKPKRLAAKLLAVRRNLGLSQIALAQRLNLDEMYHRISEYETGRREPNLMALLAYARVAGISTDILIDDETEIALIERERSSKISLSDQLDLT